MYVVIAGERRLRASKAAGRATIPCVVHDGPIPSGDLLAIQLLENCLREDLKPVEQARAFKALMEAHGWTITRVAQELGMDQSSVSKSLAVLDLSETIQEHVEEGRLAPSVAYEVGKIEDPAAQQAVADRIVAEGLSRSEAIPVVNEARAAAGGRSKGRGAGAKARKVTSRTYRAGGFKITVENRRGIEDRALADALVEIATQVGGLQDRAGEAA
jgi:ParB family transcriptional regulator, chromosome partitioning protein